jgi:hypothetical protein
MVRYTELWCSSFTVGTREVHKDIVTDLPPDIGSKVTRMFYHVPCDFDWPFRASWAEWWSYRKSVDCQGRSPSIFDGWFSTIDLDYPKYSHGHSATIRRQDGRVHKVYILGGGDVNVMVDGYATRTEVLAIVDDTIAFFK